MSRIDRPTAREIGRIAENQPGLLNLLVAYFVMEWQSVRIGNPPHGVDQMGTTCIVPEYTEMWGVNACVHFLLRSPLVREPKGPGYISRWLSEISG